MYFGMSLKSSFFALEASLIKNGSCAGSYKKKGTNFLSAVDEHGSIAVDKGEVLKIFFNIH
jgi:hypothetical protein